MIQNLTECKRVKISPPHSHVTTLVNCPGWEVFVLPDRTQTICFICGRVVPIERTRLFFGGGGTYRTCLKGDIPHSWDGKKYGEVKNDLERSRGETSS